MKATLATSPPSLVHRCGCPVVSEVLRPRLVASIVAATGAAQLLSSNFHFGLPCPFYAATGIPCPGCGLTRSVLALLHGHLADSLRWHPFGPLLLAGLSLALITAVMPEKIRRPLLAAIASLEKKSALIPLLLILFGIFYLLRIITLYPLPISPDWHI